MKFSKFFKFLHVWPGKVVTFLFGEIKLVKKPGWWPTAKPKKLPDPNVSSAHSAEEATPKAEVNGIDPQAKIKLKKNLFWSVYLPLAGGLILLIVGLVLWWPQDRTDIAHLKISSPPATELRTGAQPSPLSVEFNRSVANIELVGQDVTKEVQLEPAIRGNWKWASDQELVFVPGQDWPEDQEFHINLPKTLFSPAAKIDSTNGSFRTEPFRVSLEDVNFSIDPRNPEDRRIYGTFAFNYPVDKESLADQIVFELRGSGKEAADKAGYKLPGYSLSWDGFGGRAYFRSEVLGIPPQSVMVGLEMRGGVRSQAGTRFNLDKTRGAEVALSGKFGYARWSGGGTTLKLVRNLNHEYEQVLNLDVGNPIPPASLDSAVQVWLLPADRKGIPGWEDELNHDWTAKEVDDKLLAASVPVQLERLPTAEESSRLISFRYKAPSGRTLYIRLKGLVNVGGGYVIEEGLEFPAKVPEIPKSLDFLSKGSLLSLSGDKIITLVSNDLDAMDIRINKLLPEQVNHFISMTYGNFEKPEFLTSYFNENNISAEKVEHRILSRSYPGANQYTAIDFAKYMEGQQLQGIKYGLFLVHARDASKKLNQAQTSPDNGDEGDGDREDYHELSAYRFVLVTDLGIIAKHAFDKSWEVFVQDLRTGKPRAGALVEVLGRNGISVLDATTDNQGRAHFPDLSGFHNEKEALIFAVHSQSDLSFLPIQRADRVLNFSRFDVGGLAGMTDPEKITAFLFNDRGIYRPGEVVHVGMILKAGDWAKDLTGLPLEIDFLDPSGNLVKKMALKASRSGFEEFNYRLFDTAATGKYIVNLSLVRKPGQSTLLLGSTTVRVEEFTPDKLAVRTVIDRDPKLRWSDFKIVKATVNVTNLFGTPAEGNVVEGTVNLRPVPLDFAEYSGFRFNDTYKDVKPAHFVLNPQTTGPAGATTFEVDLSAFLPGTYEVDMTFEAKEKQGGRGVVSRVQTLVSPLTAIVGYHPDGDLDFVRQGSARAVELLALDATGQPTALKNLKVLVQESRYLSVLVKSENDRYVYQSVNKITKVSETPFQLTKGRVRLPLKAENPGDFIVTLLDERGTELTRFNYSVVGKGNLTRPMEKNAELDIKLGSQNYTQGDEVEIQIRAPYSGAGLITIERDRVYATKWFYAEGNNSVQTIRIPDDIEGTAYINIAYQRALDSREIFTSPLSYGVVPFQVNIERRRLPISLKVPAEIRPGQDLTIQYSTPAPSRIILFAVDEGILQYAKYVTPKPLEFFFRKRSLEVSTSQILDLLLPEYSILRELSAAGGDSGEDLGKRQNPFKKKGVDPVAWWSGLIEADATTQTATYRVPTWFNGKVRVMAVAVNAKTMGSTETTALVRSDLILTPSLPGFVAPGDEFTFGVNVANNLAVSGEAEITVSAAAISNSELTVLEPKTATLKAKPGQEKTVWFRVKAAATAGVGSLKIVATTGKWSETTTESLSVRPPVAWLSTLESGVLRGQSIDFTPTRKLDPAYRQVVLNAAVRPAAFSAGLKAYLDDYPFGCTEQLLSRAVPALSLSAGATRDEGQKALDRLLPVLEYRTASSGAVGLWSARDQDSDGFLAAYTAHVLHLAASNGLVGGTNLKERILSYLKQHLDKFSETGRAYAHFVLALSGINPGPDLEENLTRLRQNSGWEKTTAGLFEGGTLALIKKQAEAEAILTYTGNPFQGNVFDFANTDLGQSALKVYLGSLFLAPGKLTWAGESINKMIPLIAAREYSTWSSAWAIMAFEAYIKKSPPISPEVLEVVFVQPDNKEVKQTFSPVDALKLSIPADVKTVRIRNLGSFDVFYQFQEAGFDNPAPTAATWSGIEVTRLLQSLDGKDLTSVRKGETVKVTVRLHNTTGRDISDLAVTDLVPGGFEVVLENEGNRSFADRLGGDLRVSHAEAREDRVLVFGALDGSIRNFSYEIKALQAGNFVLPTVTAESMYQPRVRGISAASALVVDEH